MNKLKDIGNHCVECGCDTSFGSGNFVNRIPANFGVEEGYMCAECQCLECDRCEELVLDWRTVESTGEFVCDDCLTPEEHKLWEGELDI